MSVGLAARTEPAGARENARRTAPSADARGLRGALGARRAGRRAARDSERSAGRPGRSMEGIVAQRLVRVPAGNGKGFPRWGEALWHLAGPMPRAAVPGSIPAKRLTPNLLYRFCAGATSVLETQGDDRRSGPGCPEKKSANWMGARRLAKRVRFRSATGPNEEGDPRVPLHRALPEWRLLHAACLLLPGT